MIMTYEAYDRDEYDEVDMGYYDNPDGERWAANRQAQIDNEREAQMEADYEIRTISGAVPGVDPSRPVDPRGVDEDDCPF